MSHKSSSPPPSPCVSSSHSYYYEEPLKFDIAILHLVLQRNRNQHSCTSYYRRLEMVIRAITRYGILGSDDDNDIYNEDNNIVGETSCGLMKTMSYLQQECNRMVSIINRNKAMQRRYITTPTSCSNMTSDENYKWTISKTSIKDKSTQLYSPSSSSTTTSSFTLPIIQQTIRLHQLVTNHIPEILSRIIYASSSLFIELSRGYFVPLCTTSLGCISRIRSILLQLGKDGCAQYQILRSFLEKDYISYIIQSSSRNDDNYDGDHSLKEYQMKEVNRFLHCYQFDSSHMEQLLKESYIDVDDNQFSSIMNERLLNILRQRYVAAANGSMKIIRFDNKHSKENNKLCTAQTNDKKKKKNNQDNDALEEQFDNINQVMEDTIEDIVGEQVDIMSFSKEEGSTTCESQKRINDIPGQKDNGDKNLEMLTLFKERTKTSKKSKSPSSNAKKRLPSSSSSSSPDDNLNSLRSKKRQKGNADMLELAAITSNKNDLKRKEKKTSDKKKKTKKKKKKDVIDDIFDSL